jgi:hypothetical protein
VKPVRDYFQTTVTTCVTTITTLFLGIRTACEPLASLLRAINFKKLSGFAALREFVN